MKRLLAAAALLLFISCNLCAQDDEGDFRFDLNESFDNTELTDASDNGFAVNTDDDIDSTDDESTEEPNLAFSPAVSEIVGSNPETAEELLKAVNLLAKLDRTDLAKTYLQKLIDLQLESPALVNLHRKYGSGIFVQMSAIRDLNPEASEFATSALQAVREHQQDPTRLAAIVDQIIGADPAKHRRLAQQLIQAGPVAVLPMMKAIANAPSAESSRLLRTTIAAIGSPAVGPLLAYLDSPDEQERVEASRLLGYMHVNRAIPYLCRSVLIPSSSTVERQTAATAIHRISGHQPESKDLILLTERIASQRYDGRVSVDPDVDGYSEGWIWSKADGQPRKVKYSARDLALFRAARHYTTLRLIDPQNGEYHLRDLIASADMAKLLGGLNNPFDAENDIVQRISQANSKLTSDALKTAMEDGHIPAMIGLCNSIGIVGDASLLRAEEGQPSPLSTALTHANPRVRFAAADAIAKIGPVEPFAGESHLVEVLAHFGSSIGRRSALVAHPRIEIGQSIAGLLNQAGFNADVATSSQEMLSRSSDSIDYEFFVVSAAFDRPVTSQLIQLLRRNPLTASIPVGVLARSPLSSEADQISVLFSNVIVIPETKNADTIGRAVRRLTEISGRYAISAERRGEMAAIALSHLADLLEKNQLHGSDPSRIVHQVRRSSTTRGLASQSVAVLGKIGSEEAQSYLLDISSQHALPLAQREQAAKAFEESVQRHGVILSGQKIAAQYEIYNAAERLDPSTQQVLGAVLDVIENRLAE